MALEIEGSIKQILPVQQGQSARGAWAKQEFVLEFPDGNFTSQASFVAWGQDKVQELAKYSAGDKVKVSFNIKGREFNGRWYNDLQIWRLAPAAPQAPVQAAPAKAAPVQTAPAFEAPAPTLDDMPAFEEDGSEDLPF